MAFSLREIINYRSICAGIVCGILSAAIDLDHLPRLLTGKYIEPIYLIDGFFDVGRLNQGRPLHNLCLVIACIVFVFTITILFQYDIRRFVKKFVKACIKAITGLHNNVR